MSTKVSARTVRVVVTALVAAVTVTGGGHPVAETTAQGSAVTAARAGDLNCNETEEEYHGKGYVYFYSREDCKGSHGAKDDSDADSDHGGRRGPDQEVGQQRGLDRQHDGLAHRVLQLSPLQPDAGGPEER